MARLAGVDLPRDKRVEVALTYIYGIGKTRSNQMLAASGVETIVTDDRVQQLGGKSLDVIEQWLEEMSPEKEGE